MDLQQLTSVCIDRGLVDEIPDQTTLGVQSLLISSDRPPNPLLQSSCLCKNHFDVRQVEYDGC